MKNTLSFKAIRQVTDVDEAKELVKKLADLGFTFEYNKAYVSHNHKGGTVTYTVMDVTPDAPPVQ